MQDAEKLAAKMQKGQFAGLSKAGNFVQRYDTAEGFAKEWATGAFGGSWRDTDAGRALLDRFTD